jgi:hypothetical protein
MTLCIYLSNRLKTDTRYYVVVATRLYDTAEFTSLYLHSGEQTQRISESRERKHRVKTHPHGLAELPSTIPLKLVNPSNIVHMKIQRSQRLSYVIT